MKTVQERFWSKVDRRGPDDCWPWLASTSSPGYGQFYNYRRPMDAAHRFSWELHFGPIPEGNGHHGTCVCHRCDNRLCVNPAHLFLGSQHENNLDRIAKGRTRGGRLSGDASPSAKLNSVEVLAIRKINAPARQVAAGFGVSRQIVTAIRRREAWASLSDPS